MSKPPLHMRTASFSTLALLLSRWHKARKKRNKGCAHGCSSRNFVTSCTFPAVCSVYTQTQICDASAHTTAERRQTRMAAPFFSSALSSAKLVSSAAKRQLQVVSSLALLQWPLVSLEAPSSGACALYGPPSILPKEACVQQAEASRAQHKPLFTPDSSRAQAACSENRSKTHAHLLGW